MCQRMTGKHLQPAPIARPTQPKRRPLAQARLIQVREPAGAQHPVARCLGRVVVVDARVALRLSFGTSRSRLYRHGRRWYCFADGTSRFETVQRRLHDECGRLEGSRAREQLTFPSLGTPPGVGLLHGNDALDQTVVICVQQVHRQARVPPWRDPNHGARAVFARHAECLV